MPVSSKKWVKDPSANLFYIFDFAQKSNGTGYDKDYLDSNEELILSGEYPLFNTTGNVLVSNVSLQNNNTQVRFMLSGGDVDRECNVTCRILTSIGQVDEFTKTIVIKQT